MHPSSLALLLLTAACTAPAAAPPSDSEPAPVDDTELTADSEAPPEPATDSEAPPAPADTDTTEDTDGTPPAPVPCAGQTLGTAIGECAPDFSLLDADGASHALYEHAGDLIVLDFSAMWCPHCRNLADDLQRVHETHGAQGVTVITVLHENVRSEDPSPDDLRAWTDAYGLTHLVLADPGATVEAVFGGTYQPNALLLDRDLTVLWRMTGGATANTVEQAVIDAL